MRAVKAEVTSSKPFSLSKAAAVLSHFTASETGARPDVAAYLRRAAASFKELVTIHREIRHQQKISQKEGDELSEEEDDGSHQHMKKKKVKDFDGNSQISKQILEDGKGGDESLGYAPVEANGEVQEKAANGEEEKGQRVGTMTESNRIVANNEGKKKEIKEEKKKKGKEKEESRDEMKREEMGSDGKRSVERTHKKENKQEGRLLKGSGLGLISEAITRDRKKRKHSYLAQGGIDGEMAQQDGKRKNKRKKVE